MDKIQKEKINKPKKSKTPKKDTSKDKQQFIVKIDRNPSPVSI
jgi:hypothetical protein